MEKYSRLTSGQKGYPISIAILYWSGSDPDMIDTLESVKGIRDALVSCGHTVRLGEVNARNWKKMLLISGDIVFNFVEDESYQYYLKIGHGLEMLGRAQIGHDLNCLKFAVSKEKIKARLSKFEIKTPNYRILGKNFDYRKIAGLRYPLIIKPSSQHAGIGITQDSVVKNINQLKSRVNKLRKQIPGKIVLEEYIEGREIHVTVLGNGKHIFALPPCEITFLRQFNNNWPIYSYDAKWREDSWQFWDARINVDVKLSRVIIKKLEKVAIEAFKAVGCKDIARMDIRLDKNNNPYIVDVNICPSINRFDEEDATTASALAVGWNYEKLVETIVLITYRRKYGHLPNKITQRSCLLDSPRIFNNI